VIRYARALLWAILLLGLGSSAFAQGWAVPAKTPETLVSCASCPGQAANSLTVGYKSPIASFAGRFIDSTQTSEWFGPVRAIRAWQVNVANNRIYVRASNGAIASYAMESFIQRLESNEPMMLATQMGVGSRFGFQRFPPGVEEFLRWDSHVHPEGGLSSWQTKNLDGGERVKGWDVDDEGYVYVAATVFGWGVHKDNAPAPGSFQPMPMQKQFPNEAASVALALHYGARTYVLLGATTYDVTNRSNPIKLSSAPRIPFQAAAKTAANDFAMVVDFAGAAKVYPASALINGGSPVLTLDGAFSGAATDGTNFYTVKRTPGKSTIVSVVRTGNSYTAVEHPNVHVGVSGSSIRYGAGYLTITGLDAENAWDLNIFSVDGTTPTEVPVLAHTGTGAPPLSYFRAYYARPPAGFVSPPSAYINIMDGITFKTSNGKIYLLVCAKGIGDVYELRNENSVTVTANPTKVYPGDIVSFSASSPSSAITTVNWNFGNIEAGGANTTAGLPITSPVTHQYAGLTPGTVGNKTVTATASGVGVSSIVGTATVEVQMPAARFAIGANPAKYLFTQPNASSPAPIVVGDALVDQSSGTIASHYVAWNLNGVTTELLPNQPFILGQCATNQNLNFTAYYGPYQVVGQDMTTIGGNFPVGLGGAFVYTVRPFAAAIDVTNVGTALVFTSSSRVSPTYAGTPVTYTWELVDALNNPVPSYTPVTGGGFVIPSFSVPKNPAPPNGARVRLTIQATGPLPVPCAGYEQSVAYSQPLKPPQPRIDGGCVNGGPPCTFTVNSNDPTVDPAADGWHYQWSVTPATNVSFTPSDSRSITPVFRATGIFTVAVTVTNAFGFAALPVSTPVNVTTPGLVCSPLGVLDINPTYTAPSGCLPNCLPNEQITFTANPYGAYDDTCAPHTYSWSSTPAGLVGTTKTVSGSFPAGSYTAKVIVNNGTSTREYTRTFTVGSAPPPNNPPPNNPPPNNPPPNNPPPQTPPPGCLPFTVNTVPISYSAPSCSSSGVDQVCTTNETISFSVSEFYYYFDCAQHSFIWSFDGTQKTANAVTPPLTHSFPTDGQHSVSVTITRAAPYAVVTVPITITTTGGGIVSPPPPNNPPPSTGCGSFTPGLSLFISYSNANETCAPLGSACNAQEPVNFTVKDYGSYNLACGTHTFEWNFGDGSPKVTGKDVTHTYSGPGDYPVEVVVNNGSMTAPIKWTVRIGEGIPGSIEVRSDFAAEGVEGIPNAYKFLVKFDPPESVKEWYWNFGDGSAERKGHGTASNPTPEVYVYAAAGTYTITLRVIDTGNREQAPHIETLVKALEDPLSGGGRRRAARH
jgi:PKD repeat protein